VIGFRKPTRAEMARDHRAKAKAAREERLKEARFMLPFMTGNLESIFGRRIEPGEMPSTAPIGSQDEVGGLEESQVLTKRWSFDDD
jgi:hypothetical protein